MADIERLSAQSFTQDRESRIRGHWLKVRGARFNANLGGNVFTKMMLGIWNELPEEEVEAGNIT